MPSASRDIRLYLEDMQRCCQEVLDWTAGTTVEEFTADEMLYDAVLRNLEILGEAAKHIPLETRQRHASIDWRGVAGFRDVAAHSYFGLSVNLVWSIVTGYVPQLAAALPSILAAEQATDL